MISYAVRPARKWTILYCWHTMNLSAMLRMHAANSSRKWRLMIKNAKMEKSGPIDLRPICRRFPFLDECWWSGQSFARKRNRELFCQWS